MEEGMKHSHFRATAYILAAVIGFSGAGLTAEASVLPSGGIGLAIAKGNKLEDISSQTAIPVESIIEWMNIEDTETAKAATAEDAEEELFRNLVIAQVRSCVNVRSLPSESGEILGKLYNNSVGTFIQEEDGWYLITSGSVLRDRRGCSGNCQKRWNENRNGDDADAVCPHRAHDGILDFRHGSRGRGASGARGDRGLGKG